MQELAVGYMSGKLLLKLDAINYVLQHHASENFSFLDDPANSRNRSTFYYILARLLFMEDTPAKFKAFVAPLQQVPCPSKSFHVSRALVNNRFMSRAGTVPMGINASAWIANHWLGSAFWKVS